MHIPQSLTTATELVELASVPTQIISPRECKPIISIVQDIALGVYRITKHNVRISQKQAFNILSNVANFNGIVPKPQENGDNKYWTGRQILSTIIPTNINIRSANKSYDGDGDDENFVVIENGIIRQGIVDKAIYQNRTKGLVHSIYNECGPDETRLFFDNTQRIICDWLVISGFSVGISDLIIEDVDLANMKETIRNMKIKVYDIIRQIHEGKFDTSVSMNENNEFFEEEVNKILNETISQVGKLGMSKIDDMTNRMINMVKSGSKGNATNVSQIIACLGQQNVDGRRISYGFKDRTLPHFHKYDDGPESRGFVENSFVTGLSPQEFFFHAMGGREGLIDTAVKTSETGYIQRKLVKAMEDAKINYDNTVRNASGSIIQFLYGEDGMDSTKIESQNLPYIEYDMEKLERFYLIKGDEKLREHFREILDERTFMIEKIFDNKQESGVMYPISFARKITMMRSLHIDDSSDIDPLYVLEQIEILKNTLFVNKHNRGNQLLKILINAYLSPKRVIYEYKFGKQTFDKLVKDIKFKFYDSLAHPSEMVGVVAAQSIGEPCTQMTLNSVEWNTKLLLSINNILTEVKIGEYIDIYLENIDVDDLEHHPNDTKLGWIKDADVKILSCDRNGKISWEKVEAVTRHPPMNKDGTNTLLEVTTRSRRSVVATKAKSFLKRIDNEIVQVDGTDIKVGDFLPVSDHDDYPIEKQFDVVPDVILSTGISKIHRDKVAELFSKTNNKDDKAILQNILDEEIMYDEVVSIKEIKSEHSHVYDLTVENTRNFNIYNGLAMADTFHLSGVASASKAVRGVPRIKELLSVTKNIKTPVMTIHVKDEFKTSKVKCKEILNTIQTTYIKDIAETAVIFYDPVNENTNIDNDRDFVATYVEYMGSQCESINVSSWLLRFEFNKEKMLEHSITMLDVNFTITEFYDVENLPTDDMQVMFSDDNADKLVVRIKLVDNKPDERDMITELKALEKSVMDLKISGISKVVKVVMTNRNLMKYDADALTFAKQPEWVLETSGTNLLDILAHKNIDAVRTFSNDINEIMSIFGIEAARQALFNEISDVISSADLFVNYRHIALLVDTMTNRGYLLSIDRHGINRGDIGPLAKCSFEETTDMLTKSGVFAELDKINGVASTIMLGQISQCGTGDSGIMLDESMIESEKKEDFDLDFDFKMPE